MGVSRGRGPAGRGAGRVTPWVGPGHVPVPPPGSTITVVHVPVGSQRFSFAWRTTRKVPHPRPLAPLRGARGVVGASSGWATRPFTTLTVCSGRSVFSPGGAPVNGQGRKPPENRRRP